MNRQILLIDCPDAPGLVHKITGVLYRQASNIIRNQEFVDPVTGRFFMRTEYTGTDATAETVAELRALLPQDTNVRLAPAERRRIAIMATREHHCLGELLLRHAFDELGACVVAVVANHATLAPLASRFSVAFHHISHEGLSRSEHESQILEVLDCYGPEYSPNTCGC